MLFFSSLELVDVTGGKKRNECGQGKKDIQSTTAGTKHKGPLTGSSLGKLTVHYLDGEELRRGLSRKFCMLIGSYISSSAGPPLARRGELLANQTETHDSPS